MRGLALVTLLALVVGATPAAASLVVVDGGVALASRTALNAGKSELHPLLTLRGGGLFPVGEGGLLLGADGRLLVEPLPRTRGTADVGSWSWELAAEPRGLLAWRLGDGPLQLLPYAFVGALVGGRLAAVYGFGEDELRGQITYGASAGAGGLLRIGLLSLSLELGAGLREDGPAVTSALLVGTAF